MRFPMCGAKGEGIQCRTEDPNTRGGEDRGYLERGSGGVEVGETREGGEEVGLPQREASTWQTGSQPRL